MNINRKECKWFPVCPIKKFYENGTLSKQWIERYCMKDWEMCKRYHMEEKGILHPDWMLPDGTMDEQLHNHYNKTIG